MFFAMPAMAAPVVISKKQIAQPIPNSILPTEARSKYQELSKTLVCGDTTYRTYRINISRPNGPGPGNSSDLIVTSATRGASIKYHIGSASSGGSGDGGHSEASLAPIACGENGVYVTQTQYSAIFGSDIALAFIPYASFGTASAWDKANRINRSSPALSYPAVVDGIMQMPGVLTVNANGMVGDSRPATIERNGSITLHTLPWYRDLRTDTANVERVNFYRLRDGYGVKETIRIEGSAAYSTNYYRIHDGESAYTKVDNLPITYEFDRPCMSCFFNPSVARTANGVTLVKNGVEIALIHRLPTLPRGTEDPIYLIPATRVVETATTYIVNYQIVNTQTNTAQYWQTTIQK
jgi:hypothetical protein